jgi:L-methionine (R)-S-oxide reductase
MLDEAIGQWLRDLLGRHGAVAGSVHVVRGDALAIVAAVNLPPKVVEITASIPSGKGMAGLAWQHDKPIQTCNLQDDDSGQVRPGAKAVDARGAVAMPVRAADGAVRAIVGLAWADERVLDDAQLAAIATDASSLPA